MGKSRVMSPPDHEWPRAHCGMQWFGTTVQNDFKLLATVTLFYIFDAILLEIGLMEPCRYGFMGQGFSPGMIAIIFVMNFL